MHRINDKNLKIMLDWFKTHAFDHKFWAVDRTICKLWALYNRSANLDTYKIVDVCDKPNHGTLRQYAQIDEDDVCIYDKTVRYILAAGTHTYKIEFQNTLDDTIYIEADNKELNAFITNLKKIWGRYNVDYTLEHMGQINLSETDIYNMLDSIDWQWQNADWFYRLHTSNATSHALYSIAEEYYNDRYMWIDDNTLLSAAHMGWQTREAVIIDNHMYARMICNNISGKIDPTGII